MKRPAPKKKAAKQKAAPVKKKAAARKATSAAPAIDVDPLPPIVTPTGRANAGQAVAAFASPESAAVETPLEAPVEAVGKKQIASGASPRPSAPSRRGKAPAVVGRRLRKLDSLLKATGQAQYTDDIALPRMLHCKILRSPHAHARIKRIDFTRCLQHPGVHAVLEGSELPAKYGVIPWTQDENALAVDKVRFIGDEVAAVAAVDELTAEEAIELIDVEYEVLPALVEPEAALAEEALKIHEQNKRGNITKHVDLAFGDVQAALGASAAVAEQDFFYAGSTHAPIEPHCAIGHYDAEGNLTVWSSTQIAHYVHRELAKVLQLDPARIRVIQPFIGGAFGGKSDPFSLEFVVAKLSMKTGRPVKCLWTREEVFWAHRGRHPMKMKFKVGLSKEGRIEAVDSKILIDGGAYSSFGLVTAYYSGQLLTGPYQFGTYHFDSTRVFTNKPPCGPKRGHGSVQPRFAFEVALDMAAEKLGLDPIEVRRKNFIGEQTKTVNGQTITSNGFLQCLEAVERASGWREKKGKLGFGRGLGVAGSMYISGTAYPIYPNEMPQSGIQVKLDRSGKVTIYSGGSDIGQGTNSLPAFLISEEIGCDPRDCTVVVSDTDLTPVDLGAYSSRGTFMIGLACVEAGQRLWVQLAQAVAEKWKVSPAAIEGRLGTITGPGGLSMTFREAVQLAEAKFGTLGATGSYRTQKLGADYRGGTIGASPAYSFTAHVAEVNVDVETGVWKVENIWAAHDCGRAINPTLVQGQIEGSVYMGFAEAAMEEMTYLPSGLHRGPSLLDYRIPTTLDTPEISSHIVESVDPTGPFGAKEAGEGPLHAAIPAISNAIYDAVGVRLTELPFHPSKLLALLKQKQTPVATHVDPPAISVPSTYERR
ncbi:MAG: molybdopterin-dependent oxidoreductase [Myxococcaceae bacterium]|nr:molybdopterin-dependent oxidoreductase [Myxococcaceae bacterium]